MAVATEKPADEPPAIDPELARALEQYKKVGSMASAPAPSPSPVLDRGPAPGQIVETTARAEDIPEGFIATRPPERPTDGTDRIRIAGNQAEDATEHNAIDVDAPESANDEPEIPPEQLAQELDRVVAKFEEEMDKADKH